MLWVRWFRGPGHASYSFVLPYLLHYNYQLHFILLSENIDWFLGCPNISVNSRPSLSPCNIIFSLFFFSPMARIYKINKIIIWLESNSSILQFILFSCKCLWKLQLNITCNACLFSLHMQFDVCRACGFTLVGNGFIEIMDDNNWAEL